MPSPIRKETSSYHDKLVVIEKLKDGPLKASYVVDSLHIPQSFKKNIRIKIFGYIEYMQDTDELLFITERGVRIHCDFDGSVNMYHKAKWEFVDETI